MKFDFRTKEDNCKSVMRFQITKGNIVVNGKQMFNYSYDYHKDYILGSKLNHPDNLVNTRFQLRDSKGLNRTYFAKLNWAQLFWLRWVRKDHWLQKNSNLSLIISFTALVMSAIALWIKLR